MKSITKNSVTFEHFPFFDGIRALSIIWVIIHHIPVGFPNWFEFIRIRGDLGVELFFTISGFLVCRSLHQSFLKSKLNAQNNFLKKRFFRILPPYFLTLSFISLLALFDKSLLAKLISIKDILFSFPSFSYNYFRGFTNGTVPGSLNIFWSLCFEEQFYLGLFFLSFFNNKYFQTLLIILLISSVLLRNIALFNGTLTDHQTIQMQTHLRLDSLLLSTLLYLNYEQVKKFSNWSLFIFIIMLATIFFHSMVETRYIGINYLFISLSFSLSVIFLINNTNHFKTFLSNNFIQHLGQISYEVYLTHKIIIGIGVRLGLKNYSWLYLLYSLILSFVCGHLFFTYISNPINLYLRKRFINEEKN